MKLVKIIRHGSIAQYVFICKIKTAIRFHAIIHGVPFRTWKIPMNHHVGLDLQEDKIQSDSKVPWIWQFCQPANQYFQKESWLKKQIMFLVFFFSVSGYW